MGKRDDGGEGCLSVDGIGNLASSFPRFLFPAIFAVSHKVRPSQNTVSPSPKVCKVTYYIPKPKTSIATVNSVVVVAADLASLVAS